MKLKTENECPLSNKAPGPATDDIAYMYKSGWVLCRHHPHDTQCNPLRGEWGAGLCQNLHHGRPRSRFHMLVWQKPAVLLPGLLLCRKILYSSEPFAFFSPVYIYYCASLYTTSHVHVYRFCSKFSIKIKDRMKKSLSLTRTIFLTIKVLQQASGFSTRIIKTNETP